MSRNDSSCAKNSSNKSFDSIDNKGSIICAVVENRSREICVAAMNTAYVSSLDVSVLTDSQSYAQTMTYLDSIQPNEVLLHDGTRGRVLSLKIVDAFQDGGDCRVLFVSRQYFDQDRGAELLKRLSAKNLGADVYATYVILAACNCLLRYIENVSGRNYAPCSLRVNIVSSNDGKMVIDRRSSVDLELIVNARSFDQRRSLFGVINHTKTSVGARLLRSNILSPSTDIPTLEARLDLVSFFLLNERVFAGVFEHLVKFSDLDRMLSGLVTIPKTNIPASAAKSIETIICLRHTIQLLDPITKSLETGIEDFDKKREKENWPNHNFDLLATIIEILKDPKLKWIEEKISGILTESTTFTKSAIQMRHQECFAVQPDFNGMLDVSRKTFLQSIEDIYSLADSYTMMYPDIPCTVKVTAARGYHLQISSNISYLPDIYIQAVKSNKFINCTTEQISSLSDRATEALHEALLLTNQVIQDLMETIRSELESIFALVESIALLDMLFGFADLVATSRFQYTRPILISCGDLIIENGIHPVVGTLQDRIRGYTPSTFEVLPLENYCIITGANGSGKSTFLKHVACLVVLAQIGCYVPASKAQIPVRDKILTRISTSDDMEHNLSSFLVEMRDMAHILSSVANQSLILIDELGRGTSTEEGRAIAWAISEALIYKPAITLFVTHFAELCSLASFYPNVKNMCLISSLSTDCGTMHSVAEGPSVDLSSDYGIQMAEQCGFPSDLIDEARRLRGILAERSQKFALASIDFSGKDVKKEKLIRDTVHLLSLLKCYTDTNMEYLKLKLNDVRDFVKKRREAIDCAYVS